jgi:hypothetical protein
MVWKPFVLGDCVPCVGSRLKNPLSFYCLTIVSSESLAKGMGTKYLFCLPGLYLTAYFANNEVYYHHFSMENVCVTSFGQFSFIKTNMCRVKLTVQPPCLFIA